MKVSSLEIARIDLTKGSYSAVFRQWNLSPKERSRMRSYAIDLRIVELRSDS